MAAAKKRPGRQEGHHHRPHGESSHAANQPKKAKKKHFLHLPRHVDRITDAKKSPVKDCHDRRRLYMILQVLRIPILIVAAGVLWLSHNVALGAALAFISVPLPWVAVMLANEKGEATKESEKVYKPAVVRAQRAAAHRAIDSSTQQQQLYSATSSSQEHPVIDHEDASPPSEQD